jgi:uncharacterized protein YjbI with pentapeptide repeats
MRKFIKTTLNKTRRYGHLLGYGFLIAAISLSVWSVLYVPTILINDRNLTLTPKEQLDAEASIRTAIVQIIGGSILIAGLYFTARGFRLTREGHITDRYSKSVEQIGHENADVRLGGIFALERTARNSIVDRNTVVEVLTAFVREHTRDSPRKPKTDKVTADVQAALTVLGRFPIKRAEPPRRDMDFYHCGLNDADLMGADFRNAMFYYCQLVDTRFARACLDGAGLSFCKAERAAFTGASARGANFVNAVYKDGWFLEADLTDADFYGCDLTGSDFGRRYAAEGNPSKPPAILTRARFTKATLRNTNLRGVDLRTVRGLEPEQLREAIVDKNTIMPEQWGSDEN